MIEDNPGDVQLIKESFSDGNIANTLQRSLRVKRPSQAALDFVYRRNEYEDASGPDIGLLDLILPRVDGEDVLHEIEHHPELEHVPVIVLTGVDETLTESRDLCHDTDEDAVLEKPVDPGEFAEVIRSFDQFRL
ncbi:response regulator [Halobiforma lacisalsi AJ5]|uniref:Response regulator n=1 Tax=Natronobacterium lacisalsi AJ5 TaxID=358396 RepID=M0L7Q8_NATLA|nr:response regulator [Halobiforma lacisalsi]APW98370.1 response regulator [Halobiforma lacisalsi AJ5]EMA27975.1 response regulator receiver protein [Halobiforma lacisalsi AJ5]